MAAALSTTKGPSLRCDRPCITRATSSLPEPAPPRISTRLLVGATRSMDERSWLMAGDLPIISKLTTERSLQLLDLALQLGGLERAQRHQQQPVGLEGLLDVVVGAALDGGDGGLDVAVAGDDDDRQIGVRLLDDVEHLQAVEAAALQPDVQDDELRAALLHRFQGFVGIAGETRAVTVVLQEAGDHLADVRFVVDDQDVGCHLSLLHTLAIMRRRWRRPLRARHAIPSAPAPCSPAAKCGSGRHACVPAPAGRPRGTACRRAAPRS